MNPLRICECASSVGIIAYLVGIRDFLLRLEVLVEISEVQEAVVLQQHVGKVRKATRLAGRVEPAADLLDALPQFGVALVVLVGVVSGPIKTTF